LQLKFRILV